MPPSDQSIDSAEEALGVVFPTGYRDWLQAEDGFEADLGGTYLKLYGLDELVEANRDYNVAEFLPGFVLIGTNGGSEGVGFDFRRDPPPLVLANLAAMNWDEAIDQADTFDQFLRERGGGEPFRW